MAISLQMYTDAMVNEMRINTRIEAVKASGIPLMMVMLVFFVLLSDMSGDRRDLKDFGRMEMTRQWYTWKDSEQDCYISCFFPSKHGGETPLFSSFIHFLSIVYCLLFITLGQRVRCARQVTLDNYSRLELPDTAL